MRAVKSHDTSIERQLRRLLWEKGLRGYRLRRKDLPGRPDIVFPRLKLAIFVNGCFWHGHECARGARLPRTNADYWTEKIRRNKERDSKSQALLESLDWRVAQVWECELAKPGLPPKLVALLRRLQRQRMRQSSKT